LTTKPHNPEYWLAHSEIVHSASAVESAIDDIAIQIKQQLQTPSIVLMCVMRGGLYLSGQLMAKLAIPMQIDYVQANRYHGTEGDEIVWTQTASLDLRGQTVLVVDDILDVGITLAEVVKHCQQAGAKQVLTAVLTEKDNGLQKPIQADFIGLTVPNAYVFGCGMDVHGWWRNLPEIRVLHD
jgi:hypoxanthine phosphoribosyltransferase